MSIGLKSDSSGTSGSIVINGSDAVLVTTTGITTASIQDSSITFSKLSTSATEADNAASRVAKAWVNFDGTTNTAGNCTIRADFNVSTVADNGTGNYTVNFTTNMTSVNYVVSGLARGGTTGGDDAGNTLSMRSISTSGFSLFTGSPHIVGNFAAVAIDATLVSAAVFA